LGLGLSVIVGAWNLPDDGDFSLRRGNENVTKLSAFARRALSNSEQRGGTEGARVRLIISLIIWERRG
jgi:hypothetical protein